MKKEILRHKRHLEITFERLIALLFMPEELELIAIDKEHYAEHIASRSRWITIDEIVIPGATTDRIAFSHLLWLQSIGRVVIEDVDPLIGAIRLHLYLGSSPSEQKNSCGLS